MVSPLIGGMATGFVQGMDIRSAQEAKAAEIRARAEEARLAREHAEGLQEKGFRHAEHMHKLKIAEDKKNALGTIGSAGLKTLIQSAVTTPNRVVSLQGIPEKQKEGMLHPDGLGMVQVGPNGEKGGVGYVRNPTGDAYNNNLITTTMENLRKGNVSPEAAFQIPGLRERALNIYNSGQGNTKKLDIKSTTDVARLRTILGVPYRKKQSQFVTKNAANRTSASADFSYHPIKSHDGTFLPNEFLKLPKTRLRAFNLTGIATKEEHVKRLSGSSLYVAFANLKYFNNYLEDLKSQKVPKSSPIYKALLDEIKKPRNAEAYKALVNTGGILEAPSRDLEKGKSIVDVNYLKALPNLHPIYKDTSNQLSKQISKVSFQLEDSSSQENIEKYILANKTKFGFNSQDELDTAMSAGVNGGIVIETHTMPARNENSTAEIVRQTASTDPNLGRNRRVVETAEDAPQTSTITTVTITGQLPTQKQSLTPADNVDTSQIQQSNVGIEAISGKKKILIRGKATLPDNEDFIKAITLDLMAIGFKDSHKRKMEDPEYNRQYTFYKDSGLFQSLRDLAEDPRNKDKYAKVHNIINKVFDFEETNPVERRKVVQEAISAAMEERYKLFAQKRRPAQVDTGSGTKITSKPKMVYVEPPEKVTNQLLAQKSKIVTTNEQVSQLESTIGKLGLTSLAKKFATIKGDGAQELLKDVFDVILSDREFSLKNPAVAEFMNLTGENKKDLAAAERLIKSIGRQQSTELIQKSNIVFQTVADITVALKSAAGKLGIGFFKKPKALIENINLTSRNFTSGHDSARDGMTRSRLAQIEQLSIKAERDFQDNVGRLELELEELKGLGPWNKLTKAQKQERLAKQGQMAAEFLKAKQTALKISLTYYFAGLVQGESGGRAISNEDFAILFRALWAGGVGGPMLEGGFSIIRGVMNSLEERNEALTDFLGWGKGSQLADNMINLRRARDDFNFDNDYVKKKLLEDIRNDVPISGMPGRGSWIEDAQKQLPVPLPQAGLGHLKTEKRTALSPKYNQVMGSIIKDRNIGPIKDKRSIESFPQKSWEEVLPKTKDSIIKGISEAIFEKLKGKRGNEALTVLNTIRYKTEKGKEIKMFVGDAFQWMIDASKGKVTEQFEKGDVAQKVVKLFVEDLFNSRRPRR